MKDKRERHIGFRVDETLLAKFRYVCDYEGRSATAQLIRLMQKLVLEYEKRYGEIKLEDNENESITNG